MIDWNAREKEMVANEYARGEYGNEVLNYFEVEIKNICGFSAMHPSSIAKIAKKGGVSAHAQGRAHKFTPEEAKTAGAKGGRKTAVNAAEKRRKYAGGNVA